MFLTYMGVLGLMFPTEKQKKTHLKFYIQQGYSITVYKQMYTCVQVGVQTSMRLHRTYHVSVLASRDVKGRLSTLRHKPVNERVQ